MTKQLLRCLPGTEEWLAAALFLLYVSAPHKGSVLG